MKNIGDGFFFFWHRERSNLFRFYLELVVFGEAEKVAALHGEQVLHRGLTDADHFC